MINKTLYRFVLALLLALPVAAGAFEADTLGSGEQRLVITFIGHGTLMFGYGGAVVHVDPTLRESDYEELPLADLILITHEHGDHLDPEAVAKLLKPDTDIICNANSAMKLAGASVMNNGDSLSVRGLEIAAVPAYNIVQKRGNGQPYHPRGNGNGYVISFGERKVYVAGDTEYVPEMDGMRDIDVAFLPMNMPYTMTVEMGAEAARAIRPRILYPYHYGNSDLSGLKELLGSEGEIELRIRQLQ